MSIIVQCQKYVYLFLTLQVFLGFNSFIALALKQENSLHCKEFSLLGPEGLEPSTHGL